MHDDAMSRRRQGDLLYLNRYRTGVMSIAKEANNGQVKSLGYVLLLKKARSQFTSNPLPCLPV